MRKLLIIAIIATAGILFYQSYIHTEPAAISFTTTEELDLVLMACRPYLPHRAIKKTPFAAQPDLVARTQSLGDIYFNVAGPTNNVTTTLSALGECVQRAKTDNESLRIARLALEREASLLMNTFASARGFSDSLPLNRFTRDIFFQRR